MTTIIDRLIERHQQISASLETQNEISLKSYADDEFRKVLVLSIASYFEYQIVDAMSRLAESAKSEQAESSLDYALEDIVELYGKALNFVAYLSERIQPQNNTLQ